MKDPAKQPCGNPTICKKSYTAVTEMSTKRS